jgi:hypothetical protein
MFCRNRKLLALAVLASFTVFPLIGAVDNRFAVAIGADDHLVISGPSGAILSEIPLPTLAREIKVGDGSLQVSYVRDANGLLTAVLTPSKSGSGLLQFSALGRNIDADKADVTLTFSPDRKSAKIDPGYVGTVDVDSHRLLPHLLSDDAPIPAAAPAPQAVASTPEPAAAPAAVDSTPAPATPPVVPAPSEASVSSSPGPAPSSLLPSAPPMLANQLNTFLPPANGDASSHDAPNQLNPPVAPTPAPSRVAETAPAPVAAIAPAPAKPVALYWSEPVTAPDGTAPQVGPNEIKLVEVHGEVAVVLPTGETQTGTEGFVVPSGSTVRTLDNSSAALFMGGVDSARMMPQCELVVTQNLEGSTRNIVLDLHRGAVFARAGRRDGERQNFEVHSPEGNADANSSELMAFRGSPADLQGVKTTMRSGLVLDKTRLLAWNAPAASRHLLSDLPQDSLGILTSIGPVPSTYYYFAGSKVILNAVQIQHEIFTNNTGNAVPSQSEPDAVLQSVMLMLQPFNLKLIRLLNAINAGTESSAQLSYYHGLVKVFFDQQVPGLIGNLEHRPNGFSVILNQDSAILFQDLRNFSINSLTPM